MENTNINTNTNTIENGYNVPISSHKADITNKNNDYRLVGLMTIDSKYNENETDRYIYENNIDYEAIADAIKTKSTNKTKAVKTKIGAMAKAADSLIEKVSTDNGIAYKIRYSTDNKYYVSINSQMIKRLSTSTNDNMIRLYIIMCVQLQNGRKQLTYEWLAEQMGLSTNGGRYRTTLATLTEDLALLGFIKKYEVSRTVLDKNTNSKYVNKTYDYELATYEEWKQHTKSAIIRQ